MRIDDIDPDELDEMIERRRRRRVVLVIAAIVAPLLAVAAVVVVSVTGDDDEPTAATESIADTVATDDVPAAPDVPFAPQGPNEFPDFGSDFRGEKLPLLTRRTNESGISITVQKLDWDAFGGGGGIFIDRPIPMIVPPPPTIAIEPPTNSTVAEGSNSSVADRSEDSVGSTEAVTDSAGGPPRPVNQPVPTTVAVGEPAAATAATSADTVSATAPPNSVTNSSVAIGWQPAGWCGATGAFRVTMRHGDSIGTATGQFYDDVRDDMMVTLFSSGYAEADPFRVLVLQVSPNVTAASVVFEGGGADAAAAENGFVALGVLGNGVARFTVTLQIDGAERVVASADIGREGDADWMEGCAPPPPELPDAGAEQPDDPAGAEAEVRETFDVLFDRSIPADDKPDGLLDDRTGVDEALAQVDAGPSGSIAQKAEHVMQGLVFTSATEAWFEYTINTTSGTFTGRFGVARLIDGRWRIAREVVCQDLLLAGVSCDPPVFQIQPPA